MGLMKYLKKFNESSAPNDIKVGDIVLAQTYVGAPKGFEDLKYEVTEVFFDEMENNWKAKLKGIDWVGKNIYFSLDRLKKTSEVNESVSRSKIVPGDKIVLDFDIERNPDDGEYGYSVDAGEIGEIRYLLKSSENNSDDDKQYMVRFSDKEGKKRYVQLIGSSFHKYE